MQLAAGEGQPGTRAAGGGGCNGAAPLASSTASGTGDVSLPGVSAPHTATAAPAAPPPPSPSLLCSAGRGASLVRTPQSERGRQAAVPNRAGPDIASTNRVALERANPNRAGPEVAGTDRAAQATAGPIPGVASAAEPAPMLPQPPLMQGPALALSARHMSPLAGKSSPRGEASGRDTGVRPCDPAAVRAAAPCSPSRRASAADAPLAGGAARAGSPPSGIATRCGSPPSGIAPRCGSLPSSFAPRCGSPPSGSAPGCGWSSGNSMPSSVLRPMPAPRRPVQRTPCSLGSTPSFEETAGLAQRAYGAGDSEEDGVRMRLDLTRGVADAARATGRGMGTGACAGGSSAHCVPGGDGTGVGDGAAQGCSDQPTPAVHVGDGADGVQAAQPHPAQPHAPPASAASGAAATDPFLESVRDEWRIACDRYARMQREAEQHRRKRCRVA